MKMQRKEKEGNELTKPKSGSFFASGLFFYFKSQGLPTTIIRNGSNIKNKQASRENMIIDACSLKNFFRLKKSNLSPSMD